MSVAQAVESVNVNASAFMSVVKSVVWVAFTQHKMKGIMINKIACEWGENETNRKYFHKWAPGLSALSEKVAEWVSGRVSEWVDGVRWIFW